MNEPKSKAPRYMGAVLVILAAGAVGYFSYRFQAIRGADVVSSPVPAEAKPDSAVEKVNAPEPPKGKSIPKTLPEITLADRDGKPTKLHSFGGRPLMVNFWATWCAPCRREIPLLNKIRTERKSQNAEIVGVAVDFREDVLKFIEKTPLNYPLLIGEEDGLAAAEAFGMGMAFPFSVFVDSQNRILTVKLGELHEDEANFAFDRLKDIDDGRLSLEDAQSAVVEAFRTMSAERAKKELAAGSDSQK